MQEENLCNNSQEFQEILSEEIQVALKSNRNVLEQCKTQFKSQIDQKSPRRLPTRPLFRFSRPLLHSLPTQEKQGSKSPQVQKFEQNQNQQNRDSQKSDKFSCIKRAMTTKPLLPALGESPLKSPNHHKPILSPNSRGILKSRNSIAVIGVKSRMELRNTLSALLKGKSDLSPKLSLRRLNTSRPFSSRSVRSPDLSKYESKSRNGERIESTKASLVSAVNAKRGQFFKSKSPSLDSLAQKKGQKQKKKVVGLGGLTQCMSSAELRATIARGVKRLATQLSSE